MPAPRTFSTPPPPSPWPKPQPSITDPNAKKAAKKKGQLRGIGAV